MKLGDGVMKRMRVKMNKVLCVFVCAEGSPVSPYIHQRLHPIHNNMTET